MKPIPSNEQILNCTTVADNIPSIPSEGATQMHPRQWLSVLSPAQCREWEMPEGFLLVGDFHITRGGFTIIGGPAGLGKSRAALYLAACGATGENWFGLPVHQHFKTFILQNENGPHRLKADFATIPPELDDSIRITSPPEYGLRFDNPEFREHLKTELDTFQPDLVVIDPLTNVVNDSAQSDYTAAFDFIRESMPTGDNAPAVVLVAHTRKPKGERAAGTELNNELLGSTKLGSVPRCVFIMQPASNDTTDNRIVWTCCKNNDGQKGKRTAWRREDGLFTPVDDFDWDEFDDPPKGQQPTITEDTLRNLFQGRHGATRKTLAAELQEKTGCSQSTAYGSLSPNGRFATHLSEADGLISWRD